MTRRSAKTLIIETEYGVFPCIFEPEKDMGGYAVEARGVPGAISWGKNLAEARRMIKEAIEGAIEAGIVVKADKQGVFQVRNSRHVAPVV